MLASNSCLRLRSDCSACASKPGLHLVSRTTRFAANTAFGSKSVNDAPRAIARSGFSNGSGGCNGQGCDQVVNLPQLATGCASLKAIHVKVSATAQYNAGRAVARCAHAMSEEFGYSICNRISSRQQH